MARRSEPFRPAAPIVPELAAGAILVHAVNGDILLLHELVEDRWSFPKGHVDSGESLRAAAEREVREETGITPTSWGEELGEVSYRFYDPQRALNVHKTTVYFLAYTSQPVAKLESTFDRAEWVDLATALHRVPYETDRRILEAAGQRISPL